jgi:hypothetical protein
MANDPTVAQQGHALQDDAPKEGSDETVAITCSGQGWNLGFYPDSTRPPWQEVGSPTMMPPRRGAVSWDVVNADTSTDRSRG